MVQVDEEQNWTVQFLAFISVYAAPLSSVLYIRILLKVMLETIALSDEKNNDDEYLINRNEH